MVAGICVLASACSTASAEFPAKDIRIIIPFSPGGGFDSYIRALTPILEKHLGSDVTILPINTPGAGGRRGALETFRAKPDGYTIGVFNMPGVLIPQLQDDSVGYDLGKITWLATLGNDPYAYVVNGKGSFQSFDQIMAQKQPVLYGATGPSSTSYISTKILNETLGIPYKIVTGYTGSSEYTMGVMRGDVTAALVSMSTARPYIKSGITSLLPCVLMLLFVIGYLVNVGVHPTVRPYLNLLFPIPTGRDFGDGTAELAHAHQDPTDEKFGVVKFDYNLSSNSNFMVRWSRDVSSTKISQPHPLFFETVGTDTRYLTAQYQHLFSARVLNTLKFAANRTGRDNDLLPTVTIPASLYFSEDPHWGAINIIGTSTAGSTATIPVDYRQDLFQLTNTLTWNRGNHVLKAGFDWQKTHFDGFSFSRYGGEFRFRNSIKTHGSKLVMPARLDLLKSFFPFAGGAHFHYQRYCPPAQT